MPLSIFGKITVSCFYYFVGIFILDTFVALKMLDQVTPEMKKLGEGALPDGGFYPVSIMILSLLFILIIAVFNNHMNQIDNHNLITLIIINSLFCIPVAVGA